MRLTELKPAPGAKKREKRLGRGPGSGHGKTCGKGHKGQRARSGGGTPPWFEGGQMPLYRRVPKKGFFHLKREYAIVNIRDLNRFQDGTTVTPELLKDVGMVKRSGRPIKILGDGELERKLTVQAHAFSKSALQKILSAGGKAEVI
ncbi:50S ribosomal protein L15 [Candidatus Poribacteria bacterium]|nr:50S ribosomal protein L15 [Candidatus Poribacteria bacterium]